MEMSQDNWELEYKYAGSFQTALMRAIECADKSNLAKLEEMWPKIVQAYRRYAEK
ncbi:hypothetical protein LCGC14_0544250 [marine sediment metagenome]|uniref:Uncharacterized protein n=1 Tax=marine sediment metagenome TaxID=412755 RepID=A0A0F9RWI0_9ZZZZ